MALLFLFIALISSITAQDDVSCPDGLEPFVLHLPNLLEMEEEALNSTLHEDNLYNPMPFFSVRVQPNNLDHDDATQLLGLFGSNQYITLEGRDAYIIEGNKGRTFLLKFVLVSTRYVRVPALEFFTRVDDQKRPVKVYTDTAPLDNRKEQFTLTRFPHDDSDDLYYSDPEPFPVSKVRIAFRTTAGPDLFGVRQLVVGTCISSHVV